MAIALTEDATFDPQVIVPQDGLDDETAASLVSALQSLTNRTRLLKAIYDLLNTGGTAEVSDDLNLNTPTSGNLIRINDLIADSHADSGTVIANGTGGLVVPHGGATIVGNLQVNGGATIGGSGNTTNLGSDFVKVYGRLQTPKVVVHGSTLGATYSYSSALVDVVFATAADSVTAGTSWQISNVPSGADSNVIRFVNDNTTAITIKNPAGSTIITLQRTAAQIYSIELAYVAGAWTYYDYRAVPA